MNRDGLRLGQGVFRRALVLESPDASLDDHLRAVGIEPFRPEVTPSSEEDLVRLMEQEPWELLFKRSRVEITARVLDAAPHLFGVMLCCIGDDSVDKLACARRGVVVTNDPISNGRSVTELVLGELLCLSRRIFEAVRETDGNLFRKSQDRRFEVHGKTLGIFGLGNIGKQVAQAAAALGLKIVFYDNRDVAREVGITMGWTYVPSIEELFVQSDYVTCHVSATDYRGRSNAGVLTYDHFAAFSQKSYESPRIFLNLARGSIHSAEVLVRAVEDGHVQAAMVDVFPAEPANASDPWRNPYANNPRIFSTPHIGAATLEAQPRIARHVATTTQLLSERGTLRNCVFDPRASVGLEGIDQLSHVLTIVHSSKRGTKKAIDDAIFSAGASNLMSAHRDFNTYGIAYDVIAVDKALDEEHIGEICERAAQITGESHPILAVRQIPLL